VNENTPALDQEEFYLGLEAICNEEESLRKELEQCQDIQLRRAALDYDSILCGNRTA
jgi:hypothetical protein